jgi:transcriptional regulator GlxA family with amidase domain
MKDQSKQSGLSQHHRDPVRAGSTQLNIGFILLPSFTLTPFSLMIDMLRLGGDISDRSRKNNCSWDVISYSNKPIRASCGLEITPTASLSTKNIYDYIVICGGLLDNSPRLNEAERAFIYEVASQRLPLIGICTGSFELLELGLMENRKTCVSWFHIPDIVARFGDIDIVVDQLYIEDGDRITCAGGTGTADLTAMLIARHCGIAYSQKALRMLLINHGVNEVLTQPTRLLLSSSSDDRVRRAILLMELHISNPLTVDAIARRVKISPRQLQRKFQAEYNKGLSEFYTDLRLKYAETLLSNSLLPITEIAFESGFMSTAYFSKRFRIATGVTPREFRKQNRKICPS